MSSNHMSKSTKKQKKITFRCIDFQTSTFKDDDFFIRMYGIDENRTTYCINVLDFKPFFYIKVGKEWDESTVNSFVKHLKDTNRKTNYALYKSLKDDVEEVELIQRKTLYSFDAHLEHNFIMFKCKNMNPLYKIKSLYYDKEKQRLIHGGYVYNNEKTELYETMIPPMLRFFHIQNISPSGWVSIEHYEQIPSSRKNASKHIEAETYYENINSENTKEDVVPYKICSFDIEASSSHGDFPNAKKDYKKVAYDTIDYMEKNMDQIQEWGYEATLKQYLRCVFGFGEDLDVDCCFVKEKSYNEEMFVIQFNNLLKYELCVCEQDILNVEQSMNHYFNNVEEQPSEDNPIMDEEEMEQSYGHVSKNKSKKDANIKMLFDVLQDVKEEPKIKTTYLLQALNHHFPPLEGDYVTFIGSTFVTYGEEQNTLNHCICLNDTENIDKSTQVIECYSTEKEVLLAWTKLIREQDPDIIIGYNIFGFDYPFMFDRADENDCVSEFLDFARYDDGEEKKEELQETSIVLASGAYDLKYPNMEGRLQIDVFTYMRKEFILPSYKLDYVSSYLISDKVKSYCNYVEEDDETAETCHIVTKNIKGITLGCFVHFEIINHSND